MHIELNADLAPRWQRLNNIAAHHTAAREAGDRVDRRHHSLRIVDLLRDKDATRCEMANAFGLNHSLEVGTAPLVNHYICLIHVADAHQHFLHLVA